MRSLPHPPAAGKGVERSYDPPPFPLTPETYDLRRSLGYLMICNSKMAMALAEDAFSLDGEVGFIQFLSLMALRDGVASTPGELAMLIGYNSGGATRIIDSLERAALVERRRSRQDRRSVELSLTDRGRQVAAGLLPRAVGLWNGLLKDFSIEEFRALSRLLEKLFASLQECQGSPGGALEQRVIQPHVRDRVTGD